MVEIQGWLYGHESLVCVTHFSEEKSEEMEKGGSGSFNCMKQVRNREWWVMKENKLMAVIC